MASNSATDLVMRFITSAIRAGQLLPGQRLVEKDLSEKIGVGRSSVREALRGLVADGFLTFERHRGVSVKRFSRNEVWAQHQVREMLEGLAASLAAERIATSPHRAEFLAVIGAMDDAVRQADRNDYLRLNYRFHELIVLMSGNSVVQGFIDRTGASQLRLQSARFWTDEGLRRSHAEHAPIIDAILSAFPERAEKAMRAHIQGTRRAFVEMPDSMFAEAAGSGDADSAS